MNSPNSRRCLAALLAAALLCFWTADATANLIIQTPGPLNDSSTRPSSISLGILARVDVGNSDVEIDQVGVLGSVISNLDLKYAIFEGNTDGVAPVFQTPVVSLTADPTVRWYDSPLFASPFILEANTTYWIGAMIDRAGGLDTFRNFYNSPGSSFSQNGLTLPGGTNGNVRDTFANPTLDAASGSVQGAIRLFGPAVIPEPSTLAMAGMGVAIVLAGAARRHRHRSANLD